MKKRYTLEQKKWDSPAEARDARALARSGQLLHRQRAHRLRRRCLRRWLASPTPSSAASSRTPATFDRPKSRRNSLSSTFRSEAEESALSRQPQVETETTNQHSGCGLIMTEFTSADGLSRTRESKRKRYLTYYDDEHPISAQLFGSKPESFADSARIVEDQGFDLVDLNLGCPAKRVVDLQRRLRPSARPTADRDVSSRPCARR